MKIYNQFDIVKLPFPFTDKNSEKRRPALIVSKSLYQENYDHYILAMITSAKQSSWIDDINISDLNLSGLPSESKIRFKIFSLCSELIIDKVGMLSKTDTKIVRSNLKKYIF